MSSYNYRVTEIEWDSEESTLPSEAEVCLPSWLVCSDEDVSDKEWNEIVNEKLEAKFGCRAKNFGFGPAD